MEIGGLEGVLIRAGEVSEAVPSLATAARSARESVTLQSAECSVARHLSLLDILPPNQPTNGSTI